ncbi:MAG: sensor histidine kinase [Saccharospirillum sp.]
MNVTPKSQARTFGDRTLREWLVGLGATTFVCALIAGLTQLMNDGSYALNLRISMGFGLAMVVSINLAHLAWPERSDAFKNAIGFCVGLSIGMINFLDTVFGNPFQVDFMANANLILASMALSTVFSLIVFYFFFSTYRVQRLHREVAEHSLKAAQRDKDLALSQLKLMQSQIEPHFLFNTLANVQGLIDQDPSAAKQLIAELTRMLRVSLSRTRQETTRLGDELAIVRSYLSIQAIRMGERLQFGVECPDSLEAVALPPLLIQPIVENAVIHGIEPDAQGGRVDVTVCVAGDRLLIEVIDTGLGLGSAPVSSGSGVGLRNVRDRLRLMFGDRASLTVRPGENKGTVVQVRLPHAPVEVADDR